MFGLLWEIPLPRSRWCCRPLHASVTPRARWRSRPSCLRTPLGGRWIPPPYRGRGRRSIDCCAPGVGPGPWFRRRVGSWHGTSPCARWPIVPSRLDLQPRRVPPGFRWSTAHSRRTPTSCGLRLHGPRVALQPCFGGTFPARCERRRWVWLRSPPSPCAPQPSRRSMRGFPWSIVTVPRSPSGRPPYSPPFPTRPSARR